MNKKQIIIPTEIIQRIKGLEKDTQKSFAKAMEMLSLGNCPRVSPLEEKGLFVLRLNEYRIIFKEEGEDILVVDFFMVGELDDKQKNLLNKLLDYLHR